MAHTEPLLSERLTSELARALREHRSAFTATLCGPSGVRYVFLLASTRAASAQHVTLCFEGAAPHLSAQQQHCVRLAYSAHAFSSFIVTVPASREAAAAVLATTPTSTLRARVRVTPRDWAILSLEFTVERLHLALVLENLFQPAASPPSHSVDESVGLETAV